MAIVVEWIYVSQCIICNVSIFLLNTTLIVLFAVRCVLGIRKVTLHVGFLPYCFEIPPLVSFPNLSPALLCLAILWIFPLKFLLLTCVKGMITSHSWNPFFQFLWGVVQNIQASEFQALGLMPTRHLLQRRQWHPTPVFLPGKSHGRRSLGGCSPWGGEESDKTEWLHFHFSLMHWRRKWQPTPVFLPGESQGWGRTESDTTEVT